jgi:hypothetical protein
MDWPGFNGISGEVIEPSSAGLFTLTVFNNLTGCEAADTVILDWPPDILDLEATVEVPICEGDASGSIKYHGISGGIPEYMYGIDGQPVQSSTFFRKPYSRHILYYDH